MTLTDASNGGGKAEASAGQSAEWTPMSSDEVRAFSAEMRPKLEALQAMNQFAAKEGLPDLLRECELDPVRAQYYRLVREIQKMPGVGRDAPSVLAVVLDLAHRHAAGELAETTVQRRLALDAITGGVERDHVRLWAGYGDSPQERRAFDSFVRDEKRERRRRIGI